MFSTVADTINRLFGVQHCRGYSALQKFSMSRGYNHVFKDTMRRFSTAEEYHQYYGAEYHQNIGGSSVLWRIRSVYRRVFSTGDIGDTINTLVGYHSLLCWMFSTEVGYHQYIVGCAVVSGILSVLEG